MTDKAAGCLGLLFIGLVLAVALVWGIGYVQDKAASAEYARGQAESMIIRAQGQARLDSAQASAMISAAALPWGVLAIVGLLGLGVLALAFVLVARRPQVITQPPQIIQREILYLPPPGQRRADTWRALSAGHTMPIEHKTIELIEAGEND